MVRAEADKRGEPELSWLSLSEGFEQADCSANGQIEAANMTLFAHWDSAN